MTVLKFAFRNLIRLPWRTLLYFAAVFFMVLSVSASFFICVACENATAALDEHYIFVASLVPRKKDSLSLRDIGYCVNGADILSYNVAMSENNGMIPAGAYLHKLPEKTTIENASLSWICESGCKLVAVENLQLVPGFFSGECTITDGTGITEKGYAGNAAEAVIPRWFADRYAIAVGDTITRRYYRDDYETYIYLKTEVVGIYETSVISVDKEDYPVYIPLSVAELDYAALVSKRHTTTAELVIERADFILQDRSAFEPFVLQAKENGLDFRGADLVFNNGTYDALSGELRNITSIAMIVFVGVLTVGFAVLIFFTAYLCHSRKSERRLLASLGMSRRNIRAMLVIELLTVTLCAGIIGCKTGYFAADTVCTYVNGSVLTNEEISKKIESNGFHAYATAHNPPDQKIRLEISVRKLSDTMPAVAVNSAKAPQNGEIGISRHLYYSIGSNLMDMTEGKTRVPTSIVGITDISAVKTTVLDDAYTGIRVFVSENFDMSEIEGNRVFLTPYDKDGYVSLKKYASGIGNAILPPNTSVRIVGTYEKNEYCSGNDMLVCMEDYHKLYSEFSITDENFYFQRVGEIYERGHQ